VTDDVRPPAIIAPACARGRPEAIEWLRARGHAVLPPGALTDGLDAGELQALRDSWARLPADAYLRDGGRYRFRRHASWTMDADASAPVPVPHRAHYQPTEYNALHGGMLRWFEPLEPAIAASPALHGVIARLGELFRQVRDVERWYIESHQFRIDTAAGIGRPTPEGAHRDGVDFVAVVLVARRGVRGGETRVFDAHGPLGERFTLVEPWTTLLLDDARVVHETTPIQAAGPGGTRDTLVLTYRRDGFQDPPDG
jgi:hypothetical protein